MPQSAPDSPIRVTSAARSRFEDQRQRMGQYCLLMGIRLVCIFAIFITPRPWGWLWVLGAVVLPYVAVTIANAAGEKRKVDLNVVAKPDRVALKSAPADDVNTQTPRKSAADVSDKQPETSRQSDNSATRTSAPSSGSGPVNHVHDLASDTAADAPYVRPARPAAGDAPPSSEPQRPETKDLILRGEVIHD